MDDLVSDFGDAVRVFLSQISKAGASVSIVDTYRTPQRAYVMHWSCMIDGSGQDPHAVPPMSGVNIDWTCGGSIVSARDAARQIMAGYQIQFHDALESRHT
ncbi:MAG: hypothetical protein NTX21_12275 [Alphaproteobacteria bacterium]|nr:hypothetical protein [Alphaproteobacteria bacterium]